MTTKPNASPPIICGRPYVLFDPEQTAEIKRMERKNELIARITDGLSSVLEAIDNYVCDNESDEALRRTVLDATRKLQHLSGAAYYEELAGFYDSSDVVIEWEGEVETIC